MKTLTLAALFLVSALASGAFVHVAGARWSSFGDPPDKTGKESMTTAKKTAPGPVYSKSCYDVTPLTQAMIDELATKLTPDEARVILKKGTEAAFCGNLTDNKKEGVYTCRLCGLPLFASDSKFHSGTGWPSFFQPVDKDHVLTERDESHGMERVEILCARCGSHLGHVFEDGPRPTGLRFCVNSVSLEFQEKGAELPAISKPIPTETAYFAGGCFWGVEDRFQQVPGVIDAVSGYMGGKTEAPSYKQVCNGDSGHAETVKIVFDPKRVTYKQLLEQFFKFHDPSQLNRQGPDYGTQYRSAIFASSDKQAEEARAFIDEQQKSERFKSRKIATQIVGAKDAPKFWDAEAYHQDYHVKHGGSCALPEH
jgi:peptide methionine sulfoxide reductase msrA/msrB